MGGCQAAFAAIKLKIFIGCNISPRLMDAQRIHISASGITNDSIATFEILDSDLPRGTGNHVWPFVFAEHRRHQ
jgi:hypothetical protein